MSLILALSSAILISAASLVGAFLLPLSSRKLASFVTYLVSFAAGAMLGNAVLHLLPEVAQAGFTQGAAFALLAGIIIAFILERFIVWHHCHTPGDHAHPVGFIVLFGDGIHNFLDGIVIGASYLVSTEVGIATTVAVLLHEIPQELSDFGILIHAGFSRTAALLANLASAAAAILGVILVWYAGSNHAWLVLLVPFAAGNFLYIALADIVPNLHKETRIRAGLLQVVLLLLGVGLMAAMAFLE